MAVGADVRDADIVAHDNENIGFLCRIGYAGLKTYREQ
jgi:hypothetical protein